MRPSARRSPARRPRTARRAAPAADCPSACARRSASAARRRSCAPPGRSGISPRLGNSANSFSGVHDGAALPSGKCARRLAADLEILQHRQVGEDAPVLRHEAEPAARDLDTASAARCRRRRSAPCRARRAIRPMMRLHGGRLAGAVAAHQRHHLAAPDLRATRRTGSAPRRTRRCRPLHVEDRRRSWRGLRAPRRRSCRCRDRPPAPAGCRGSRRRRPSAISPPRASTMMRSA